MFQVLFDQLMHKIYLLLITFILISCGKAVTEESDDDSRKEESIDGTYSAILIPVNSKVSNEVHGEVKIRKYADDFRVNIQIKNAPRSRHKQYLHLGSWCPKINQDINGDGYIDGHEARLQAGNIIVPFDGDLSSQRAGENLVLQGNYKYSRSTSYHLMLSDLHLADDVVNDPVVKLDGRELPLERKTVMIYTVKTNLPSSVSGREVPIACGILTKVADYPTPPDDSWETDTRNEPSPRPRPRPRPRPDPGPNPEPPPQPSPEDNGNGGWWDWVRDRWNRWRNGGNGNNGGSGGGNNAFNASGTFR